jgi:hypothetical protein
MVGEVGWRLLGGFVEDFVDEFRELHALLLGEFL